MKTKKKGTATASRFTRGEKVGIKSRHGARKASGRREDSAAERGMSPKADQDIPTA